MHIFHYAYPTIITLLQLTEGAGNSERILLSNVKTLTLRKDYKTSHNRVAAVPQVFSISIAQNPHHQAN